MGWHFSVLVVTPNFIVALHHGKLATRVGIAHLIKRFDELLMSTSAHGATTSTSACIAEALV